MLGLTYSKAESGVSITATRTAGDSLTAGTSATFTVGKGSQTITVTTPAPANATYNGSFGVAATASSGLAVAITTTGSCSGSGSNSATITMTSGTGTCTVHYNQIGDTNYNAAAEVTSATTANAATLDITASNDSKTYGQLRTYGAGSAAFTTGMGQLQNGDTIASVTVTDTNSGGVVGAAAGGIYPLTPSAAVFSVGQASNYAITYHAGSLTVNKANATVVVTPYTVTYDGSPHTATVTSITGVNGRDGGHGRHGRRERHDAHQRRDVCQRHLELHGHGQLQQHRHYDDHRYHQQGRRDVRGLALHGDV